MKKLLVILAMLVSMSTNAQWVNVPNGLSTNQVLYSLAANGDNIFAGTWTNIYLSTNNGGNWSLTLPNKGGNVFLVDGNNIYAGTSNGVYKTSNNGTNWSLLGNITQSIYALAKYGDTIFAGNYNGVFRSINNGTNWTQTSLYSLKWIQTLAIKGNNIFAGSMESPTVWRSTDNGNNWDSIYIGAPRTVVVFSLAVKGNNLFAGTDNGGVFVSSNNGLNWAQTSLSGGSINCLNINGSNIFAGELFSGQKGVYLSTNDGANWLYKNQGMGNQAVWSLTFNSQYIFSGTGTSIWRRSLSEIIGVQNISTEVPSAYSLKQNYPNPFNPKTVIRFGIPSLEGYVRPGGRGVGMVTLKIYDITGREVQTLVNESLAPGTYETNFDGSRHGGLNSGVYFYKLVTDGFTETKKMLLLK
jgi:hypothetical protein